MQSLRGARGKCLSSFRIPMVTYISCANAIVQFQLGIHVFRCGACARLQEALFEIVTQIGVQNWIDCTITVAQASDEQKYGDANPRTARFIGRCDENDLAQPIRQPTQYVNGDNGQYQFGHFAV